MLPTHDAPPIVLDRMASSDSGQGSKRMYFPGQILVNELRCRNAVPHVAQNTKNRRSAMDGRTTWHPGYTVSQRIRKRIEETFG
jgi:hypothetical protein